MIEKLDLQHASAFGDASCQPEIDLAWGRIPGWMVVNQNKGVSGMTDCGFKDLTRVSEAFIQCSFRNFTDCNEVKTGIQ